MGHLALTSVLAHTAHMHAMQQHLVQLPLHMCMKMTVGGGGDMHQQQKKAAARKYQLLLWHH